MSHMISYGSNSSKYCTVFESKSNRIIMSPQLGADRLLKPYDLKNG